MAWRNPMARGGVFPPSWHGALMADIDTLEPRAAAQAEEARPQMPLPSSPQTLLLGGLFLLALLAALYAAKEIALPVVAACLLKLLLQPAVRALERLRLPRLIGALLTIVLLCALIAGFAAALVGPAKDWAAKLPEGLPRLEQHLSGLRDPIDALRNLLHRAERVADATAANPAPVAVAVQPKPDLAQSLFSGTRVVLAELFTTILLLFFLLLSGDLFLRRTVELLPRFSDKREAVEISQHLESDVSGYLTTITAMNLLVGIATAGVMLVCRVGDPVLWGAVAFLLNFAPILGPVVGIGIFVLAGLLSFDWFGAAFVPAALYFGVHLLESQLITPLLLARRFTLNPVLVILTLVFWYWMWGVPGAILGVPLLAITKIVCDRVRPLMAFGHFLGR